jgi:hypothetical protein
MLRQQSIILRTSLQHPETEAFVGSIYHYQATADDPDGDHLTYSLVDAIVTKTGEPLTSFAPTHWLTVTDDGKVAWNPPVDLVGETITITLEVSDGKGGTALQTYLIGVHTDPVNRPPVIVTTPTTQVTLPTLQNANSTGAVEPGALNLTLDAGEKTTEIVTVNIENQALLEADIVFIVDESGSMGGATYLDERND